jgi:magnesium chelatase accessory protein
MPDRPTWEHDGRDWPNREHSRFVQAGGLRWHVQIAGSGPDLLLIHGTAAATHSWRDVLPILATRFRVIAPDMPGHGFTDLPPPQRLSLPGMASALGALITTLNVNPVLVAGHSAGAAVALRLALDKRVAPRTIVSLNGALLPLGERHAAFFTRAARMLVGLPFVPAFFAWRAANRAVAERLLRDTGSRLDARGVDLYARLFRRSAHVSAALGMMANWDLLPLLRDLPKLKPHLILAVAQNDRTVPPAQAERTRARLPSARIVTLPALGHLAHEENPKLVADLLLDAAAPANETAASAMPYSRAS